MPGSNGVKAVGFCDNASELKVVAVGSASRIESVAVLELDAVPVASTPYWSTREKSATLITPVGLEKNEFPSIEKAMLVAAYSPVVGFGFWSGVAESNV